MTYFIDQASSGVMISSGMRGRPVLAARKSITRDQRGGAARPGLEAKASATKMTRDRRKGRRRSREAALQ